MIPAEVIARKRDGLPLADSLIAEFIAGYTRDEIPEYQMSALAMAIFLQGMDLRETVALTRAMIASGQVLSWTTDLPKVDKHSTGGLGDKVSLVLAPLLACCDLQVPMISGRGLGITGGTLDKLEAIPGFRTQLSLAEIQHQVERLGCVICGATDELVPADRKLYALRDVTGTVESIPLITASVLSKKLAESLNSLVLDVKFGSGAFMSDLSSARQLAEMLVDVGCRLGVTTSALITDMNQPLGRMVGNGVEVHEAIAVMQGGGPPDVRELTCALATELLLSETRVPDRHVARLRLLQMLDSGCVYERFVQMVLAQGGRLPACPAAPGHEVRAHGPGRVVAIDGRCLGRAMIELRGGRKRLTDVIDPTVGLEMLVRLGDHVEIRQPLIRVFAASAAATRVEPQLRQAIEIVPIDQAGAVVSNLVADIISPADRDDSLKLC